MVIRNALNQVRTPENVSWMVITNFRRVTTNFQMVTTIFRMIQQILGGLQQIFGRLQQILEGYNKFCGVTTNFVGLQQILGVYNRFSEGYNKFSVCNKFWRTIIKLNFEVRQEQRVEVVD